MTAASVVQPTIAQNWYRVNVNRESDCDYEWSFPYAVDQFSYFDFSSKDGEIRAHRVDEEEGITTYVPFSVDYIDSITFVNDLAEEEQTHNKYQVYTLNITTNGSVGVTSKEDYVDCYISLDGKDGYNSYSGSGRIRGRGNSTWAWYDKKPYRIKLDKKNKMLGVGKSKDWVLLANYRDVTDLMNAFMFETARWMGMAYVNHTRFVELFLDGDYKGVYLLTEQVEQGKNRVEVADNGGILLAMDYDDGPNGDTRSDASFASSVFEMPMCVKYPKDATSNQVDSIKGLLATLETAIENADYEALDEIMDMKSFMTMAMLQEYAENVEVCAPRSVYMYKDAGGKWFMGPFWDWDAGFDFDWSDMTTGHTYFQNYKELVLGTDPANRVGMYGATPRFFTDMFKSETYTRAYQDLWNSVKDSIFTRNWAEMEKYVAELNKGAYDRDINRWPLTNSWGEKFRVSEEISKMKTWLQNRTAYLDKVINAYSKNGTSEYTVSGNVMTINVELEYEAGYTQSVGVVVDQAKIAEMLGVSESALTSSAVKCVPLNADGSVGRNTAGKTYGAWFGKTGNTVDWGEGHVYLESDAMFNFSCGCHPWNCRYGDTHTVRMQYSMNVNGTTKTVIVKVNFGINTDPKDDGIEVSCNYRQSDANDFIGIDEIKSDKSEIRVDDEIATRAYSLSDTEIIRENKI